MAKHSKIDRICQDFMFFSACATSPRAAGGDGARHAGLDLELIPFWKGLGMAQGEALLSSFVQVHRCQEWNCPGPFILPGLFRY